MKSHLSESRRKAGPRERLVLAHHFQIANTECHTENEKLMLNDLQPRFHSVGGSWAEHLFQHKDKWGT